MFLATILQALHPDVTRSARIGIASAMQSLGAGVQFTILSVDCHADRGLIRHQPNTSLARWTRAAFTRGKARGSFASFMAEVAFRATGGLVCQARTTTESLTDKALPTAILAIRWQISTKLSLLAHANQ